MEKNYKDKRNSFAERLKSEPTPLPMQKVEPVVAKTIVVEEVKVEEVQINAWIPKDLMKRVKTKAVGEEKSLKEIVIEALSRYVAD
jgi:predicted HicB family RNase H-like nuclease